MQRERGISPTNWILRWRTLLSINVANHIGRAILDSLSSTDKNSLSFICVYRIFLILILWIFGDADSVLAAGGGSLPMAGADG